jgi:hypothetical protein
VINFTDDDADVTVALETRIGTATLNRVLEERDASNYIAIAGIADRIASDSGHCLAYPMLPWFDRDRYEPDTWKLATQVFISILPEVDNG